MVKFNCKIESYVKCSNCKYFIQHYNIGKNFIYKIDCGHCSKCEKTLNVKVKQCPHFENIDPKIIKQENKRYIYDVIKNIELTLAYIKAYLSKDSDNPAIDNVLIEKKQL